jgi:hypothetical protein
MPSPDSINFLIESEIALIGQITDLMADHYQEHRTVAPVLRVVSDSLRGYEANELQHLLLTTFNELALERCKTRLVMDQLAQTTTISSN